MQPMDADVRSFLGAIADPERRADAEQLAALMERVTGESPRLWSANIVGFGSYHYTYASGREGDAPLVGFASRKPDLVVYLVGGFQERYARTLERLGRYRMGKGCLYIRRLADVDLDALTELLDRSARVHRAVDSAGR